MIALPDQGDHMKKIHVSVALSIILIFSTVFVILGAHDGDPSVPNGRNTETEHLPKDTGYPSSFDDFQSSYPGSERNSDGGIPYTFFSSVRFNSVSGRGEFLWAAGNNMIMEMHSPTGDMKIFDMQEGIIGNITAMRNNCHAVYFLGNEKLFRYDIIDDAFRKTDLPDNRDPGEILDFFPLVWANEDGGTDEGLVLVDDNSITTFRSSSSEGFLSMNSWNYPSGIGDFRWIDGYLDRTFVGFSNGILTVTPTEMSELEGDLGSDLGLIYHRSHGKNGISVEMAFCIGEEIRGFTYASGLDKISKEITENGTLWDHGLQEELTSLDISDERIVISSGDRLKVKKGNEGISLDVADLTDAAVVGNDIYVLIDGELCTLSGDEITEMNININAPEPDLVHMDTGDEILVATSNTSVSVLPGAVAPARWINSETILGIHLRRPVQCLDDQENIWIAQTSEIFRGILSGTEVSWSHYLVLSIQEPLSMAPIRDLLLVLNDTALVLFNTTTRTDEIPSGPNATTGSYLKVVGDEYEDCFWVLCENGLLKVTVEQNGNLNTTFYGKKFLPGEDVVDIGYSNNVVWILMDEGVGRYYKPTDEWWNYSMSEEMREAGITSVYSRGHEIYLGGSELYYMDEWSGVGGFMPIYFGEDKLSRITSIDSRNFQDDNTGEIYILDDGGIRIYDTSRSNWQSLTTSNGLASNDVRQVTKDTQTGDIWVAAYGGVTKYEPNSSTFKVLTSDDGLSNNFVYTAHADENGIWLGTDGGGISIITRDDEYEVLTTEDGLAADDVLKIKSFETDKYWFCTDAGLTHYDRSNGDTKNYVSPNHLAGDWVWDIDTLDDGVFVATDGGISVLNTKDGKWQRYYHPLDLPDKTVYSVDLFRHNFNKYMWAGTVNGAVCYNIDRDEWKVIDEGSGLEDGRVRDVFYDGDKVWVATGMGIVLFTPDGELLETYTRSDGLVHNMVEGFSRYGDVMYIATSGGFSMFREDSITNTLLPRSVRTPAIYPDISIVEYEANITVSENSYILEVNVTVQSDVPGEFYCYVSTAHLEGRYDAVRFLYGSGEISSGEGGDWVLLAVDMEEGSDTITKRVRLNIDSYVMVANETESGEEAVELMDNIPLYFLVDPDGRWIEESENNNLLMASLDTTGSEPIDVKEDTEKSSRSWIYPAVLVMLILGFIGSMWFLRKRRGRKEGEGEGGE